MAYAILSSYGKQSHGLSAMALFLRGYNYCYRLTDFERKHVRTLVACRLACSATLGAYSYSRDPTNEYLLLHSEPCWKALQMLYGKGTTSVSAAAVERMLDRACDTRRRTTTDDLFIPDPNVHDFFRGERVVDEDEQEVESSAASADPNAAPPPPKTVTFVTGNANKLKEVQAMLSACPSVKLVSAKIDLPELQGTPLEIAAEKVALAAKQVGGPVIVEDTSLCFNALGGMPGPYIKWFLDTCVHEGLNKMLDGFDDRTCYAQTVVAYCEGPGSQVRLFDGRTNGTVVRPRGPTDFGWDPVFQCEEGGDDTKGRTYAEMDKSAKNNVSHRGKAFEMFKHFIVEGQGK